MFEKTLTDVVKGIRASKRDTALFISQCIAEIKTELTSSDMHVKANALQKLTFLQMMGYTMNWASFATIEVMSSPRFAHKRIGYLAASQGFTQDTEVILLTTNLLQKELRGATITNASTNQDGVYEAGLAINCISNIVTADLAVDLLPEVTQLTSHPSPYLRKKAILCLFKLFVHYPQGLRLTFGKLQACLQDPNPAVVSCAVNVITELSDKNPKNYLSLAPAFFDLLTGSSNNWMLIKVVKLLGSLVPEEPRLARKLLEPLANIVRTTQAKSLLYEAVHTITLCLPYCAKADGSLPAIVPDIVQLSVQTLRSLVEESDQNLTYLGLVGFASLMQSHPRVLSSNAGDGDARLLILACLSDPDVTIRKRALDLLMGLATRKNVVDLVSQLMQHVPLARGRGNYRHDLVAKILEICSSDKYALLSDSNNSGENHFEWYFNHVLLKLGHLLMVHGGSSPQNQHPHAQKLHDEIINVALRVLPVRTHAVQRSVEVLLWRSHFSQAGVYSGDNGNDDESDAKQHFVMPEILPALAWIAGEYSDLLPRALQNAHLPPLNNHDTTMTTGKSGINSKGPYHAIVQVLSSPWNVQKLSNACQKIYLQAVAKVLAAASSPTTSETLNERELDACLATLELNLPIFVQSVDVEVVERAFTILELLRGLQLTTNTSNGNSLPGLVIDDDDDDDDDDVNDGKNPIVSGDLLGLDGGDNSAFSGLGTSAKKQPPTVKPTSSISSTLATKFRESSDILNSLLKPSPMKPVGNKTQRKKQQSGPVGHSNIDLSAPLDMSVIQSLVDEEFMYLTQSKLSLESVSFTQQRPMQHQAQLSASATPSVVLGSETMNINTGSTTFGPTDSFQNPIMSKQQRRQGDPFYLDSSSPAAAGEATSGFGEEANRFGTTIQLHDDDDEDDGVQRSKKGKKNKKKSKQTRNEPVSQNYSGADYLMFDPHVEPKGSSRVDNLIPETQTHSTPTTILDSGDEEEDDDGGFRKTTHKSKEFSNLSKVDLTRPLTEDELVPSSNRTHRAVVTGTSAAESSLISDTRKTKKQLKKERKEAKQKKKEQKGHLHGTAPSQPVTPVGDLLDLAVFGDTSSPAPTTAPSLKSSSSQQHPINAAFDDLLGLGDPLSSELTLPLAGFTGMQTQPQQSAAPSDLNVQQQAITSGTRKQNRPWILGSITSTNASGPTQPDWNQVRLMYRAYRSSQGNGTAAMIVVRVENTGNISGSTLSNVVLDVDNFGQISVGNATPVAESKKVGPFNYPHLDRNFELNGTLRWSGGGAVPVKILLPATLHLSPQEGLHLEQVAEELASSSESFGSVSTKIEMPNLASNFDGVKRALMNFLRIAIVSETSPNPRAATFAALTAHGAKLRVLVKMKDNGKVKVDFRCTSPTLANALVSDLKNVIL